MNDSFGVSLPDFNLPEKKKDEDFYKKVGQYYLRQLGVNGFSAFYEQFNADLSVYNLEKNLDDQNFWQTTEGGDVLPATVMALSTIRVKINTVINEMWTRGDKVTVKAINRDAKSREQEARLQMHALIDIHQDLNQLEESAEMPTVPEVPFPTQRPEADKWFAENYKDISAKHVQKALDYLQKRYQWMYTKYALWRDIKIHGCCFCECKIVNGVPRWYRRDPKKAVFDLYATDDFLSDSNFYAFLNYRPVADVIDEHRITDEDELRKLEDTSSYGFSGTNPQSLSFSGNQVRLFQTVGGERRVLEYTVYFKDNTTEKYKFSKDKHGNEHAHKLKDTDKLSKREEDDGAKLETKKIAVWRKVTLIGSDICKNYGLVENLVRSVDDFANAECPVKACIPGFLNQRIVSLPSQVQDLEKFKIRLFFKMQTEINSAIGSVLNVDVDRIPKGHDTGWVINNLRGFKINFYSSMKDGIPNNAPLLNPQDIGMSSIVASSLEVFAWVDNQIELITNITPARVGQVMSANQGLGVTQTSQQNSILSTEHEYRIFSMFLELVLNHIAGLVKITFLEPEQWAPIVGDAGVDFFRQEADVFLQDYGVFASSEPKIIADEQLLLQTLTDGLHQGAFGQGLDGIVMFLKAALNANVNDFIEEAEKKIAADKKDQQEHEAAMQGMQQQAQQEQQAQQIQVQQQDTAFKEDQKLQRQSANIQERGQVQGQLNQQQATFGAISDQAKAQHKITQDSVKASHTADQSALNAHFQREQQRITDKSKPKPKK